MTNTFCWHHNNRWPMRKKTTDWLPRFIGWRRITKFQSVREKILKSIFSDQLAHHRDVGFKIQCALWKIRSVFFFLCAFWCLPLSYLKVSFSRPLFWVEDGEGKLELYEKKILIYHICRLTPVISLNEV